MPQKRLKTGNQTSAAALKISSSKRDYSAMFVRAALNELSHAPLRGQRSIYVWENPKYSIKPRTFENQRKVSSSFARRGAATHREITIPSPTTSTWLYQTP